MGAVPALLADVGEPASASPIRAALLSSQAGCANWRSLAAAQPSRPTTAWHSSSRLPAQCTRRRWDKLGACARSPHAPRYPPQRPRFVQHASGEEWTALGEAALRGRSICRRAR